MDLTSKITTTTMGAGQRTESSQNNAQVQEREEKPGKTTSTTTQTKPASRRTETSPATVETTTNPTLTTTETQGAGESRQTTKEDYVVRFSMRFKLSDIL